MDELIKEMLQGGAVGPAFGIWEAMATLALSFVLCTIMAYVYRETHYGISYSLAFVHTMIIMGVTVAVIMLVIGSNIARAFALVGALSIIRFRNAVKDSRDVGFIFVCMAIGMATGTGFWLLALVFTLFMATMVYALNRLDIGAVTSREMLLKVHVPDGVDYGTVFDPVFVRHLRDHSLLSVETLRDGDLVELVYSIELKRGADEHGFIEALRSVAGNQKVALLPGQENIVV